MFPFAFYKARVLKKFLSAHVALTVCQPALLCRWTSWVSSRYTGRKSDGEGAIDNVRLKEISTTATGGPCLDLDSGKRILIMCNIYEI